MESILQKNKQLSSYEIIQIDQKKIWVPLPDKIENHKFIDRPKIIEQALAAWMPFDNLPPLNFQLYGPPGSGKNAIVYELARILNKDLYILNGHDELSAEDIACTPIMTSSKTIEYVASPLFAAMLRGGIFFFDEIGKAPPNALSPLSSVLDQRRTLHSVMAGIKLKAHKDFLFCAALNEREQGVNGLPDYIDERLSPSIYVCYPDFDILKQILKINMPANVNKWINVFLDEFKNDNLSPRMAIKTLTFAYKLAKKQGKKKLNAKEIRNFLQQVRKIDLFTKEKDQLKKIQQLGNDDEFFESLFN